MDIICKVLQIPLQLMCLLMKYRVNDVLTNASCVVLSKLCIFKKSERNC